MDNRLQFPTNEIDFSDVGFTGQDHDNYARPGTLSRYDWARILIIGLLANQSSSEDPNEFRPGTIWFDLNNMLFKSYSAPDIFCGTGTGGTGVVAGDDFDVFLSEISETIKTIETDLWTWFQDMEDKKNTFIPTSTFSGVSHIESDIISLPRQIQKYAKEPNTPYVYKNGKLVSPSLVSFNSIGCPVCVKLTNEAKLTPGDKFNVIIMK